MEPDAVAFQAIRQDDRDGIIKWLIITGPKGFWSRLDT